MVLNDPVDDRPALDVGVAPPQVGVVRDAHGGLSVLDRRQAASGERLTYSVDDTARLLGISRSMAYECVRRGEIPAVRFGRRVLIPCAAVEALLRTQTTL